VQVLPTGLELAREVVISKMNLTVCEKKMASEVTQTYYNLKILTPSIVTLIISAIGWWITSSKASEEKGRLEQRVIQIETNATETRGEVNTMQTELNGVKITMTQISTDLKYVKEDTKEALILLRDLAK